MDTAVPSVEELLVLIAAQKLQLQGKDEAISILAHSCMAILKSVPSMEEREMDDRPHVLISAKRCALTPSQG